MRLYGTPYTHGYGTAFDHEAFYSWAEQCPRPVIISEYAMPEDRFACVWERHTTTSMAAQGAHKKRIERMFVPLSKIALPEYARFRAVLEDANSKLQSIEENARIANSIKG